MILTAHQPVYLPWLGLFHKIALADMFISFNQVQYQPKDWNNRNRIKTHQGPIWLSVPVLRKGYLDSTISDIEINNNEPWAHKHWKSLQVAYAKAPHFKRYADFFADIYSRRWERLVDLNETMLKGFLDILGIKVPVRSAAEWNFTGEKSELVLDMCLRAGASDYIFGALGRDYADVDAFMAKGVNPHFQDYTHPQYSQLHGGFTPYMSIVDLLFNYGENSYSVLMSGNISKTELMADLKE
jgi:hypothetical protein